MPSKLTPQIQELICQAVRAGNYVEVACDFVGLDKSTFYDWMNKGKAHPHSVYADFSNAVKEARSDSEMMTVQVIKNAMLDNWQAAAWYLERSRPERWSKREHLELEHSGDIKSPMVVQIANQLIFDPSVRSLVSQLIPKLLPNEEKDPNDSP